MDPVIQTYLELSFRLNQLFPDIVDSYFGPAKLRESIEQQDPLPLPQLLELYRKLHQNLSRSSLDPILIEFLTDQTAALVVFLRQQISPDLSFRDYASRLLQVDLQATPAAELQNMEEQVNDLLKELGLSPASPSTIKELEGGEKLTGDALLQYFRAEIPRYRALTRHLFDLPKGTRVTPRLYDKNLIAYIDYRGRFHTIVWISRSGSRTRRSLASLIPHETFPGHALHYVLREEHLAGNPLTNHFLYHTPEATVVEGLGMWAPSLVNPPPVNLRDQALSLIKQWDSAIRDNAHLLYKDQGKTEAEVTEYLQDVGHYDEQDVQNFFGFISYPFFDVYAFSYSYGQAFLTTLHQNAIRTGREREFLDFLYRNHTTPHMLRRRFG